MGLIESDAAARKLASSLFADIELYHEAKIEAGADLSEEIEEARALYRERVAPSLHGLFDDLLAESRIVRREPAPVRREAAPVPRPASEAKPSFALAILLLLVAAAAAFGVWYATR